MRSGTSSDEVLRSLRDAIRNARGIVVLTEAGVSADSGVPTFRGKDGHWKRHRVEELATPDAFRRDPRLVWEWYAERRESILRCSPNPAHAVLASFLTERDDVTVVTQNVDGLHTRALEELGGPLPHPRLLHLHGSLFTIRCSSCSWKEPHSGPVQTTSRDTLPHCPRCGELARPAVIWFGEMLPERELDEAFEAARTAELCLVVGTSALVHPAASLPRVTLEGGGRLAEVNPQPTPLSAAAAWTLRGPAGSILPDVIPQVI